jgi:hypothetical protein
MWNLSLAMPPLPDAVGDQHVGRWSLEIRPLPAVLSTGTHDLELTILQPAVQHHVETSSGSQAVPVRRLPLQFCQLQALPRQNRLAPPPTR